MSSAKLRPFCLGIPTNISDCITFATGGCNDATSQKERMTPVILPPVSFNHDDVIKWKHFPRYWPFVDAYY